MKTDEALAGRMIAAHMHRATFAKTPEKRAQHLRAVDAYRRAFPGLFEIKPGGMSSRRYHAAEAERGRLWNWIDSPTDKRILK